MDFILGVLENALGMIFSAVLITAPAYFIFKHHPEYWTEVLNRLLSRLSDFEYHILEGRLVWKFRAEDEQQEKELDEIQDQNLPKQWYKPVTRVVRRYKKGEKSYTSHAIDFLPISADVPALESIEYKLPNWFKNRARNKVAPDSEIRVAVWGGLSVSAIVKSGDHIESHTVQLNTSA